MTSNRSKSGCSRAGRTRPASEVALCASFIAWVQAHGDWTVYAETGGFDMLLVAPDGAQLGLEAKLGFTAKVLEQALPRDCYEGAPGPDFRGVLLPKSPGAKGKDLLESLGLVLFYAIGQGRFHGPSLDDRRRWTDWAPDRRIELPAFVPDVAAGAPAPVRLTKSKIAALRLVALVEVRGYVVPQDFRDLDVDSRRWTNPANGLLALDEAGRYVRGEKLIFDRQHPRVYAEIVAALRREFLQESLRH